MEFTDQYSKLEGSDENVSIDKNFKKQQKLIKIGIPVFLEFQHKMEGSPLWVLLQRVFIVFLLSYFILFLNKSIPHWFAARNWIAFFI